MSARRPPQIDDFFTARGWQVADFQRQAWQLYAEGADVLIHAPTGSGKTLAVWGGILKQALLRHPWQRSEAAAAGAQSKPLAAKSRKRTVTRGVPRPPRAAAGPVPAARSGAHADVAGPRVLWLTPLRALADNLAERLREPLLELGLPWIVGVRTGDASARSKRWARQGRFDVLITTPESLALLLSYPETMPTLRDLEIVVVDEWHELLDNKRGVLLELMLAHLRARIPALRLWGMSASLGNLAQAAAVLFASGGGHGRILHAEPGQVPDLQILLPPAGQRFAWAGHLGLRHLPTVLAQLDAQPASIVFTNTRSQAELWFQALSAVWPHAPETLALHHGSLAPEVRQQVETGLRAGQLRCVVATSSLDLGVDFPCIRQVIQIGSPKSVARLLQRAGRAAHQPGGRSRLFCVPTHLLELLEFAAARSAMRAHAVEAKHPLRLSLDVLAQHVCTLALAAPLNPALALREARSTHAFAALEAAQFALVLDFLERGGSALQHYPDFKRLQRDPNDQLYLGDRRQALRHRLNIGTIVSDGSVQVRFGRGGSLGSVEENFIARMRPGDRFSFAGRALELVQLRDLTATVKLARSPGPLVAVWSGGQLALSGQLAHGVQALLEPCQVWPQEDAALAQVLAALMRTQSERSQLPRAGALLAEWIELADGQHLCLYPFAGRALHQALAALLAWRWGRSEANSFTFAANDYGLVLSPARRCALEASQIGNWLTLERLSEDLAQSVNLAELEQRQFREIARVAGLLPPSQPGKAARSLRSLQASSSLIYQTLREFDPGHVLLSQARLEVYQRVLLAEQLADLLRSLGAQALQWLRPDQLTPLSFPLWAERMRGQLSTEDWKTRVARAAAALEQAA